MNYVKDIVGGVTASFVLLPRNMAFGLLIFLPFGPEYAPVGIAAGVFSLLVSNVIAALIGSVKVMCLSTFSLSALLMMSMNEFTMQALADQGLINPAPTAIVLCFMATLFAGFFQMSFGVLKLGNVAKYIPYPVLTGLLNGTGIAIVLAQISMILEGRDLLTIDSRGLLLVAVAASTIFVMFVGARLFKQIPSVFPGLLLGSLAFFLVERQLVPTGLGDLVGPLPAGVPAPSYAAEFYHFLSSDQAGPLMGTVVLFGMAIGAADTLRAALSCLIVDLKTKVRSDFNQELVGEGFGNMLAALFGSISSTGNATGALSNYNHGGRTLLSRCLCGAFVIVVLLAGSQIIGLLPMVVLAAVMIVLTVAIMDFGLVSDAREFFQAETKNRSQIGWNMALELLVTALVVFADLFVALTFGLGISIGLFVMNMSKQIVRDLYTGSELSSNVVRQDAEQAFLDERADTIRVLELEGALFFGTADRLHDYLDPLIAQQVEVIIVDLKLVTQIDQTAIDILYQCAEKTEDSGRMFAISSMPVERAEQRFPTFFSAMRENRFRCFDTPDDALAWAEQYVLSLELGRNFHRQDVDLEDISVLGHMSSEEVSTLKCYLTRHEFGPSEYIIRQGKTENIMYFIARGEAIVGSEARGKFQRYSTIRVGSVVGEMSLFDDSQRSADVVASDSVVCYALSGQKLDLLRHDHPKVAYDLLVGLNLMYADRLRNANSMISRLR